MAILMLVSLAGCGGEAPPPTDEPAVTTSARSGPVAVEVALDRETMRTVDRLRVTITAVASDGAAPNIPEFDPESAGWTVIARTDEPLRATDAGLERRAQIILEPFLDGAYEVPPVTVSWTLDHSEPGSVRTEPLPVSVVSVLPPDDPGDLAGPVGMALPSEPEPAGVPVLAIAAAACVCFAIAGGLAWYLITHRPTATGAPSVERLRVLDRAGDADPESICAAVSDALRREPVRTQTASDLLAETDRVRFGRAPITPERSRALLRDAIRALEGSPA